MKRQTLLAAASLLLLLVGCSPVLSRQAMLSVDPGIEFAQVKKTPQTYIGKTLLLGGLLVDSRLSREGTTLEILRFTLDRWGEPQQPDETGGRFLVRTERFLDPELYFPGLLLTLTATVEGEETRPLNGYGYAYPVFRMGEAHFWGRSVPWPPPYGYYDPFAPWWPYPPYPYYYDDPFWYDPFPSYRYLPWYRPWSRGWRHR